MKDLPATAKRLHSLLVLAPICMLLFHCCASVTTVNIRDSRDDIASQNIETLNEELQHQTVTVRLKSGKELIADNIHLHLDSTSYQLADEHQVAMIPTDSISEVVNQDFNFGAIPRPTVIGMLAGTVYTAALRPTYHDESDAEHRVSLLQGVMFGGFYGLILGLANSAGTVYVLH